MNAAAKVMHQSNFFSGHFADLRISKSFCFHLMLLCALLFSALTVVYITNQHRVTFSDLQREEQRTHQLQLQWGQLLLEQASLATPARVQQWATNKLHMFLPTDKQTVILRLKILE
jgi:cell division protein FtsL